MSNGRRASWVDASKVASTPVLGFGSLGGFAQRGGTGADEDELATSRGSTDLTGRLSFDQGLEAHGLPENRQGFSGLQDDRPFEEDVDDERQPLLGLSTFKAHHLPQHEQRQQQPPKSSSAATAAGETTSTSGSQLDAMPELTCGQTMLRGIIYGLINSVILMPVMISFAQIIFRHPYFEPSMPYLIKLVMFSSAVHQSMFSIFSSLPFSIGQVQDAGLIFLSSMASSIVDALQDKHAPHDEIMSTVLCWLALSTMLLGIGLIITGKLKLASMVQFLPVPVVGGYLAFIGFYCLEAGFTLMSGEQVQGILQWDKLANADAVILMLPGVLLGLGLMVVTHFFKHFSVLPICLVAIPAVFHIALVIGDIPLARVRTEYGNGWLAEPSNNTEFWRVWEHYDFRKVHWDVIPPVIPTWFAMFFVVAFSSSLDVAAIQMELGKKLDFNHELITVGISNMVSGAASGFTGSYIFSQTIFTMRAKISSRVVGIVVVVLSLAVFAVPISILAYLPRFFFGAVLTFIAIDLMISWLWFSRKLVRWIEYAIIWLTFIAINFTSLEIGMVIGIGIAILVFIFQFSSLPVYRRSFRNSNLMRSFAERQLLRANRDRIVVFQLNGYIFFGSALGLTQQVTDAYLDTMAGPMDVTVQTVDIDASEYRTVASSASNDQPPRRFLVLDLFDMTGIDATAVRTCFVSLRQTMLQTGGTLVLCNVEPSVLRLLEGHNVVSGIGSPQGPVYVTGSLDSALAWCEDMIVRDNAEDIAEPSSFSRISDILLQYVNDDSCYDQAWDSISGDLMKYFEQVSFRKDQVIFDIGDEPDAVYFVAEGEVQLSREQPVPSRKPSSTVRHRRSRKLVLRDNEPDASPDKKQKPSLAARIKDAVQVSTGLNRIRRNYAFYQVCTAGSLFGTTDFVMKQPRAFRAQAGMDGRLFVLTEKDYDTMRKDEPDLAEVLNAVMLRSTILRLRNNLENIR